MEQKRDFRYCFIRMIGEGAFSRVWLAEREDGRRYACKVSRAVKILEREAEIMSGLYHPLFPAFAGFEEREGVGRLLMEYVPGRSLGQLIRFRGGISAKQAMRIAEELADGMRYLHERRPAVLYRDLKPDNIMVCEDGHIKVIDFGCACYQDAQGGVKVGTPGFAPPEQLLGAGGMAGIYSDVYSLGRTVQCLMAEGADGRDAGRNRSAEWQDYNGEGTGDSRAGRNRGEERKCRRRLEHMIREATREDFRQRPQDMDIVLCMLTGKRKMEEGIICEKNIWVSAYKNSCSLTSI